MMNAATWNVRGLNRRDHQVAVADLVVAYGANDIITRRELWHALDSLSDQIDVPWLVCGDFNAVLDDSEICGTAGDTKQSMEEFRDCPVNTGLLTLPMQGEFFTWHNCSYDARSLWKRLDCMVCNDRWLERWPDAVYVSLSPHTSDHSPLVLKDYSELPRASMFRFDNYLAQSPGFIPEVQNVWRRYYGYKDWLKGCDQCTRVFFRRVVKRRATKRIFQIRIAGGTIVTEQNGVTNEFISFYQRLLGGERTNWFIDLSFLRPWARYLLSEEDSAALIKPVTAAEVKLAFFDVEEDKSPGPDGYLSGFLKAAWPIIGEEVTQAILEFFLNGKLLKQVNTTLLVLIPKNAFIPGRSIGDNILLAQELFTGYNQQHLSPRCALKVDLRKAYDTVEWDFMLATLHLFRFPPQFIRWIEECITSTSFLVCLNGTPHGFFAGARGLHQGDPISPYLFVLVMEVLHLIFRQLIDQDGGFGYHWRCAELSLFQLCFADDLLLFCNAEVPSVSIFQQGLQRFATMSGLHANPSKSQLILSKSAAHMRATLLGLIDFSEGCLPLRYLGLPLLASRLTIADCKPLLKRVFFSVKVNFIK
ncbi:UNVERIFIED_CONTAM: Retrovirus-related Pol polyprotein from type-2 retrotransposable element R2DM [Sesamum latifolium]|uniref:Retrovirus-related Pol polyprotein from type-2 retrotransposable element R2DM n=1 Tax=Sesamum latifolium TaxID=2727402 RepID=A0AAW2UHG2_9LAMI